MAIFLFHLFFSLSLLLVCVSCKANSPQHHQQCTVPCLLFIICVVVRLLFYFFFFLFWVAFETEKRKKMKQEKWWTQHFFSYSKANLLQMKGKKGCCCCRQLQGPTAASTMERKPFLNVATLWNLTKNMCFFWNEWKGKRMVVVMFAGGTRVILGKQTHALSET